MDETAIPADFSSVNPAWLTTAFGTDGESSARVVDARVEIIDGKYGGVMGSLARVHLTWADSEEHLPDQVIIKLPSTDEANREVGESMGAYRAEHGFYTELASEMDVRVPHCWHANADVGQGEYVLVLEDLGDLDEASPIDGVSIDRAAAVLDALVELHAPAWDSDRLAGADWLPVSEGEAMAFFGSLAEVALPLYLEVTRDITSDDDREMTRRFVDEFSTLYPADPAAALYDMPLTFVHRDVHLGNIFFDGDQPVIYDWGSTAIGAGLYDVAYFLSQSLNREDQIAHGDELLTRYRTGLAAKHIDPTDEEFSLWHRVSALTCLLVPILVLGDVLAANESTTSTLTENLPGIYAYLTHYDAVSVLDEIA